MTGQTTHRPGRGLAVVRRLAVAVVALALLAALVTTPAAAQSDTEDCEPVVHDRFRLNQDVMHSIDNGSKAVSTVQNTRVSVEQANRFIRIRADNPNSYCVGFTIEIGDDAVPTADVPGSVTSADGQQTASWDAVHDFDSDQTYTRVTVTLPPNTEALFAPSADRVVALSWATERMQETGPLANLTRGLPVIGAESPLEARQYTLTANESGTRIVTVPLNSPDGSATVTDWQATYSTDGGNTWTPVSQDSDAPVFYRDLNGSVQFIFNDRDAEVRFTANPTIVDRTSYQVTSLLASLNDAISFDIGVPIMVSPSPLAGVIG